MKVALLAPMKQK